MAPRQQNLVRYKWQRVPATIFICTAKAPQSGGCRAAQPAGRPAPPYGGQHDALDQRAKRLRGLAADLRVGLRALQVSDLLAVEAGRIRMQLDDRGGRAGGGLVDGRIVGGTSVNNGLDKRALRALVKPAVRSLPPFSPIPP